LCSAIVPLTEADRRFAADGAVWLPRFYPGVSAEVQDTEVQLHSNQHDEAQLKRIWRAALLNERMHAAANGQRRQLLAGLAE
jgi:hypothetical protein